MGFPFGKSPKSPYVILLLYAGCTHIQPSCFKVSTRWTVVYRIKIDLFCLETARIFSKMDKAGGPASERCEIDVDGIESFGNMVYRTDEAAQHNRILTGSMSMCICWSLTIILKDRWI